MTAIRRGLKIGAPLHLTWSCYVSSGIEPGGFCASCRLRGPGFQKAGIPDPIGPGRRI